MEASGAHWPPVPTDGAPETALTREHQAEADAPSAQLRLQVFVCDDWQVTV